MSSLCYFLIPLSIRHDAPFSLKAANFNSAKVLPDTAICFVIALIPGIRKAVDLFKAQAGKKALARA